MTNQEYKDLALKTVPPDVDILPSKFYLILAALGAAGETGEVVDEIKKHVFHNHPLDREKLIKEMGDVEWYFNLLRKELKVTLEEVHERNIEKLSARYPEGFFTSERSQNRKEGDV